MDNIIIFGLDIDDCLSLEYYFIANGSDNLTIGFRGELYKHLKFLISMGYTIHGKRFLPIITSLSARISKTLDSHNVIMNAIPSSALLLTALAEQLATELQKPMTLDRSFLSEQESPATLGVGFQELLNSPIGALDAFIIEPNKKTPEANLLLQQMPVLGPLPIGARNGQFKLLRARQVLARVKNYAHSLGLAPSATFYFYDDVKDYLDYLEKHLRINDFSVYLKTLLVDSYIKRKKKVYQLDRSLLLKTSANNISNPNDALAWSSEALIASLKIAPPNIAFSTIEPHSVTSVNFNYLKKILDLKKPHTQGNSFTRAVLQSPFGITSQDAAKAAGFAYGQIKPQTNTRFQSYWYSRDYQTYQQKVKN